MSEWWNNFTSATVKRLLASSRRFEAKESAIDALLAGGGGIAHSESAIISDADTKSLALVDIVAAPGANRVIIPAGFPGVIVATQSVAYANVQPTAKFELLVGGYVVQQCEAATATALLTFGADCIMPFRAISLTTGIADSISTYVDTPLQFDVFNAAGGPLTGGDPSNSLLVAVRYYIVDVTTGDFV